MVSFPNTNIPSVFAGSLSLNGIEPHEIKVALGGFGKAFTVNCGCPPCAVSMIVSSSLFTVGAGIGVAPTAVILMTDVEDAF
jgi:hypothetical protein